MDGVERRKKLREIRPILVQVHGNAHAAITRPHNYTLNCQLRTQPLRTLVRKRECRKQTGVRRA